MKNGAATGIALFLALVMLVSGCASIGPDTVVRDRFDYTAALSDSWKEQMLLNLVKLRYGDTPIFLDVASVINSYELSGSASLEGIWKFRPVYETETSLGASGFYANRPTITYSPLSGEKFARSLMTPVPIGATFNLIQSGYPADLVLRLLVQSVNGVKNRYGGASAARPSDSMFYELVQKMKRIQAYGTLGLKAEILNGQEATIIEFGRETDQKTGADIAEVKKILRLDPREREFTIVYGLQPADDREIAVLTRSVLQVLIHLVSYIEVPESHVAEKLVYPTFRSESADGAAVPRLSGYTVLWIGPMMFFPLFLIINTGSG